MNSVKRLLMVAGALALAAIVGMILSPKAAHGIVATLVQVVNTAANPAITEDISRAASQIVAVHCNFTLPDNFSPDCVTISNGFSGGTFTVPADKNFVITSIDFKPGTPGTGVIFVNLFQGIPQFGSILRSGWTVTNATNTVLDFSTSGIVLGPGSTTSIGVGANAASVEFHGYLTSN
jgi:hypothetical protein